jgi:hypothetical protein
MTTKCTFCKKEFSSNQRLKTHIHCCKVKFKKLEEEQKLCSKQLEERERIIEEKNKEIEQKDEQIAFLKTLLETCVQKPNIRNNNSITINNNITTREIVESLEPIEFDDIKESMKDFNFKYIRKGVKGLAEYLCKTSCNGKIIVTDNSRDILAYNTKQKKFIRDPRGQFLLNKTLRDNSDVLIEKIKKDREWMYETQEEDEFENDIELLEKLHFLVKKSNSETNVDHLEFSAEMKKHGIETLNKKIHAPDFTSDIKKIENIENTCF